MAISCCLWRSFLLKGLEEKWRPIALQTSWMIEPVLRFSDDLNATSLNREAPPTEFEARTSSDIHPSATSDVFFRGQVSESLPMEGVNSHHTNSSLSHLHNSTLFLMYINARSVFCKLDNLKLVCAIHQPDVICIVESWLDKEISDSKLSLDGYNVSRIDRNRHAGGVLIFVKSTLVLKVVFNGNCDLELLIVSVHNSCNRQCCIGVCIAHLTLIILF